MTIRIAVRRIALAAAIGLLAAPAVAQDSATPTTTADDVRAEISRSMDAVSNYTAQERDKAVAEAREAMDRLDAEIERRNKALRENWAEMSDSARAAADQSLHDLRTARNELGEKFGALKAGTSSAWDDLKTGFSNAWDSFSETWNKADSKSGSN